MNSKSRNTALIVAGSVVGLLVLFTIVVGVTMSLLNSNTATNTSNQLPQYERVSTEDFPYAGRKRFVTKVLIEDRVTKEELIEISKNITKEMIEERRYFQALEISYFNHNSLIDFPPTLGVFIYAPEGDWGSSIDGKSDFSNYEGDASGLKEKNWENSPDEYDLKLFTDYSEFEMRDDGLEFISNKYDVSKERAKEHIDKAAKWIYE